MVSHLETALDISQCPPRREYSGSRWIASRKHSAASSNRSWAQQDQPQIQEGFIEATFETSLGRIPVDSSASREAPSRAKAPPR